MAEQAAALLLDQRFSTLNQFVDGSFRRDHELRGRVNLHLLKGLADAHVENVDQDHEGEDLEEGLFHVAPFSSRRDRSLSSDFIASPKTMAMNRKKNSTMIEITMVAKPWVGM